MAGLITIGITTLSVTEAQAGCAGDCMTCHENLKSSKEHKPLETCIECHEASQPNSLAIVAPEDTGSCGNDCFHCHNFWPNTPEHKPLDTCQTCHLPGTTGVTMPPGIKP